MWKAKMILFLLFVCTTSYSQDKLKLYKSIYEISDSLKKNNQLTIVDKNIFKEAKKIDQQHPSKYFETAEKYIIKSKFNEASFFYYLGIMRYQYYNKANPEYQASHDGSLLGSLSYTISQPTILYLKTDINNYISILKIATEYYKKNDFKYFSKSNNIEKYNQELNSCLQFKIELENNKVKYSTLWDEETKKLKKSLNI